MLVSFLPRRTSHRELSFIQTLHRVITLQGLGVSFVRVQILKLTHSVLNVIKN